MRAFKPQSRLALFAAIVWCAAAVYAQTPAAPSAQTTPSHHHHTRAAHAQAPAEPTPPPPPPPNWPINSTPVPPSVKWNATGLSIEASNASLRQILDDVAAATGTRVEGFNQDQRVFGNFGPGRPRDVLSQLLQGSGYNIVMVGDQGSGAPRELLLSGRNAGGPSQAQAPHPAQDDSDDDSYDGQIDTMPPAQPPPEAIRFAPDAGRTPQQIQQELQQRQQQMLIQQQNQQRTTNPPPN